MKKIGRNDPCVCGSGKKFKKCCENKMIGKRFMDTKIETPKTNLSSFFQKKITQISKPKKTIQKKIKTEIKPNQTSQRENTSTDKNSAEQINPSNELSAQKS